MLELAQNLADVFRRDFASADREIVWTAVEEERQLQLDPYTTLIGRIDARGTIDGDPFFADWKTASAAKARRMEEVKAMWRSDPQALTYGVLLGGEARRFTVRWAIKTNPPQTAFEWYSYTEQEIVEWTRQLKIVANQIRDWRLRSPNGPWLLNRGNCFRYGVKYKCPFFETCPSNAKIGPPRVPHTDLEARLAQTANPEMVVLSSSRVGDYLDCPEAYRRKWEGAGFNESSEALDVGTEFHSEIQDYLKGLMNA